MGWRFTTCDASHPWKWLTCCLRSRRVPGNRTLTKTLTGPHFRCAGILQHPDGTVLKQLQPPPRGPRELEFYTMVSDVRCCIVLRAPQFSAVTQSEKRVWQHVLGPLVTNKPHANKAYLAVFLLQPSIFRSASSRLKESHSESLNWFLSTGRDPQFEKHLTERVCHSQKC